jgi:type I restriction enzyme S subunit
MKRNEGFKETEIGKIPEDWEVKEVGETCVLIRNPFMPDSRDIRNYVALEHIEQGTLRLKGIGKSSDAESNKFVFKKGQVLFGKLRPYFRKVYRPDFDGVCSTDIFVIDAREGFDTAFLFYFFANQDIVNEATRSSEGTRMPRASWRYITKLTRAYPPLPEQRAIAKILSDLDAKSELNRQMNQTLEQIGQALFKRWFVDFEFPDENGRPYKSSGGELVDSDLGMIPKGWEIGKLGSHISFNRGCSYTSEELRDSENALVTLKSIERGGGFKADGFKPYTGDYKEHHIVKNGDVVVAHTDLTQNAEVLGKPAIVREVPRFKKLIASMDLGIVRPNDETTSNSYLYYLLKTDLFQNHAYGYASGTTVFHLSSKAVPEFRFALAPKELVKRFSKVVDGLTAKIRQAFSEAEDLSEIRDSLLPKLLSGNLRVGTNG